MNWTLNQHIIVPRSWASLGFGQVILLLKNQYYVDSHPAPCNFQDLLKIHINVPVLRLLGRFSYIYINKRLTWLKLRLALRWEGSKAWVGRQECSALNRITNQEPCGGFEKASSTQVQGKRAAKTRRKTNLGTLLLRLFQHCKLGKDVLKETLKETLGKEMGIRCKVEGHVMVWLGSSESHAPTPQPSDRGCNSVFLCWGGWIVCA